ncbi:MAG: hypothetical protein JWR09_4369 [Mucilaginibacter sp.]|nr:hypothetical protein [Mucilaginibacter sp.]
MLLSLVLICSTSFFTITAQSQTAQIKVDAGKVLNKISPVLYGSCTEDVNHEIYGGLYNQLLFGESFEEPAPATSYSGWMLLPAEWRIGDNGVPLSAGPGFKFVRNHTLVKDGTVEATINFGDRSRNAGLLVRLNNVRPGNPNPTGYAIDVSRGENKITIKKYLNGWRDIAWSKKEIDIKKSVRLRVNLKGNKISVFVNDEQLPSIEFIDKEHHLLAGQVGIYANNAAAKFTYFSVAAGNMKTVDPLSPVSSTQVSSQWTPVYQSAKGLYQIDSVNAFTGRQAQVIQFISGSGKVGISNSGLNHWGIAVKSGQKFVGSVYLRAGVLSGPITVTLESTDGKQTYATSTIKRVDKIWRQYKFSLTAKKTDTNSRFSIYLSKKGKVWIDQATLVKIANKTFKGLPIREDIGGMMQKQGLNFLRYGGSMVNAPEYKWKNMTGDRAQRPPYNGHWYPYSSNGFGIEEFLQFCESAHFEPAVAINTEDSPDDIANMVEYLTGKATSTWGGKRAMTGHIQPYKLRYIEIGNEEVIWGDKPEDYQHYARRFNTLYKVIHAKNPDLQLICAAWWRPESPNMESLFNAVNGKAAFWDLHVDADNADAGTTVDKNLQDMQALFKKWDAGTTLRCAIFEENGRLHNMQRALGHASILNAVRRHGDFVLTSCPANALQPYLQNDNDWDQGQIFFTPNRVWGMPPFYVQQMASENHLALNIGVKISGPLDVTATRSEDGRIMIIHVINSGNSEIITNVALDNFAHRKAEINTLTLAGKLSDKNTPHDPEKIKPVKGLLHSAGNTINYNFPAHSYTILRFNR